MYRKEIGNYYEPYYDSGDYPQEINVYDTMDKVVSFDAISQVKAMFHSATDCHIDEPFSMDDYYEEIRQAEESRSKQLVDAEEELYKRMAVRDGLIPYEDEEEEGDEDEDDFTIRINGKVVV